MTDAPTPGGPRRLLSPGGWRADRAARASRHPVLGFLGRRLVGAVVTLFAASVLIFVAVEVLPGDAASNVLGRSGTPERIAALQAELGLDRPLVERYADWAGGLLHGDLGDSTVRLAQGAPDASVGALISEPLRNSAVLAVITTILLIPLGLLFGALAGVFAGRKADHAISTVSLAFLSLPEFVLGTLLIVVFFSQLDLLPPVSLVPPGTSPLSNPDILVLPVLTLLGVTAGSAIRLVRVGMVDVLRQDYVATARLNGFSERRVIWRYALRNALAPSVQIMAQNIQYLFGGLIVVESLFSYPGIGTALIRAINSEDANMVAGVAMVIAALYVAINIVADLIVVFLVPKLRTQA
jgi:peptide/nickel transport system permease protein